MLSYHRNHRRCLSSPMPCALTMTTDQRGYRVYLLGMEVHIASNQGATRGHGQSLVGPQHGRGLSLPSYVVSYRCFLPL